MAYIGNSLNLQSYTRGSDRFSGDGTTTTFTLSRSVASAADIQVVVNNVIQDPYSAYSVLGTALSFTGAPSSGTNNVYVVYNASVSQYYVPTPGTVVPGNFAANGSIISIGNLIANATTTSTSTTTGALVVRGGAGIAGNVIVGGNASITSNLSVTQSGLFQGPYDENSLISGVFVGNTGTGGGITPRVGFFNGNTQQNWQIDNNSGEFRWFVPGSSKMTLYSTGNLNITGGYTVGGKKAVNGPAFRAYISTGQTIASAGAQVKVTFGSETFDTDGCFSSSRFTPTVEGYYQLNATVRIAGTAGTGENMLVLYKNGGEYARGTNGSGTEIGANFYSMQVSDIVYANGTTDFFEVYIQQGSGSNRDTTAGTNISYFSGCMIRGA